MSNALYDPTPFMEGSGAGGAGGAGGVGGGGASGAGGPPYVVSTASDKTDTPKDKDDAYARSENLQVSRTDMNLLIMNYLVTGEVIFFWHDGAHCLCPFGPGFLFDSYLGTNVFLFIL